MKTKLLIFILIITFCGGNKIAEPTPTVRETTTTTTQEETIQLIDPDKVCEPNCPLREVGSFNLIYTNNELKGKFDNKPVSIKLINSGTTDRGIEFNIYKGSIGSFSINLEVYEVSTFPYMYLTIPADAYCIGTIKWAESRGLLAGPAGPAYLQGCSSSRYDSYLFNSSTSTFRIDGEHKEDRFATKISDTKLEGYGPVEVILLFFHLILYDF